MGRGRTGQGASDQTSTKEEEGQGRSVIRRPWPELGPAGLAKSDFRTVLIWDLGQAPLARKHCSQAPGARPRGPRSDWPGASAQVLTEEEKGQGRSVVRLPCPELGPVGLAESDFRTVLIWDLEHGRGVDQRPRTEAPTPALRFFCVPVSCCLFGSPQWASFSPACGLRRGWALLGANRARVEDPLLCRPGEPRPLSLFPLPCPNLQFLQAPPASRAPHFGWFRGRRSLTVAAPMSPAARAGLRAAPPTALG